MFAGRMFRARRNSSRARRRVHPPVRKDARRHGRGATRRSGAQSHECAAVAAAQAQTLPVAESDLVVAPLERAQLADAAPIDDDRTVDADELLRIELLFELAQRLPVEIGLARCVQLDV